MMTRRNLWWLFGVVCFALATVLIALWFDAAERSSYNGKSLQEWFDSLDAVAASSPQDPNVKAITAIGRDAVPFLMYELCISESSWAERFRKLWSKVGLVRRSNGSPVYRRDKAYYCLIHLGTNADSALPELIKIAEDEFHPSCLNANLLLGFIRSKPTNTVPVLQRMIAKPRTQPLFDAAICSLARYGTNARPALPRLKEIVADAKMPRQIRVDAASARVSIDPPDRQSLDFIVAQWEDKNPDPLLIIGALERLGSNSLPALPAMRRIANNQKDVGLRTWLSNELQLIDTRFGVVQYQRQ